MLLGMDSIDLIVRTAIPAAALSILVGMVCSFQFGRLVLTKGFKALLRRSAMHSCSLGPEPPLSRPIRLRHET